MSDTTSAPKRDAADPAVAAARAEEPADAAVEPATKRARTETGEQSTAAPANAKAIKQQLEFYFSDSNLPRDNFLRQVVRSDPDGWVPFDTLLNFNKLKALTRSPADCAASLQGSLLLQISEDGARVRRTVPLPSTDPTFNRSIWVRPFGQQVAWEHIRDFFAAHGPVLSVRRRRRQNAGGEGGADGDGDAPAQPFKRSAFVEFDSPVTAERIAAMSLEFDGVPLEMALKTEWARRQRKAGGGGGGNKRGGAGAGGGGGKQKQKRERDARPREHQPGCLVRLSGVPAMVGDDARRKRTDFHDLRPAVELALGEGHVRLAFVDHKAGADFAVLRFVTPEGAQKAAERLADNKAVLDGQSMEAHLLNAEEEAEFRKATNNPLGGGGKEKEEAEEDKAEAEESKEEEKAKESKEEEKAEEEKKAEGEAAAAE